MCVGVAIGRRKELEGVPPWSKRQADFDHATGRQYYVPTILEKMYTFDQVVVSPVCTGYISLAMEPLRAVGSSRSHDVSLRLSSYVHPSSAFFLPSIGWIDGSLITVVYSHDGFALSLSPTSSNGLSVAA